MVSWLVGNQLVDPILLCGSSCKVGGPQLVGAPRAHRGGGEGQLDGTWQREGLPIPRAAHGVQ